MFILNGRNIIEKGKETTQRKKITQGRIKQNITQISPKSNKTWKTRIKRDQNTEKG